MKFNPSLTARLRIGFVILFALLLVVSLLGVGRLYQIRVDFEQETRRYFQLEVETEQLRSNFNLEEAAVRPLTRGELPDPTGLEQAAADFQATAERAGLLTGTDSVLTAGLKRTVTNERAWRRTVGEPLLRGESPPLDVRSRLTRAVTSTGDGLAAASRGAREAVRESARRDTRDTTIVVVAGLFAALIAAVILFSGLIKSMRTPLAKLVEGARRLAGGDLDTRVEAGGPNEIAELGRAFNEMADALEHEARERDRVERMKDDFVLTVSHELRTPVTVVKGFAEMLTSERASLSARQYEAAAVIADSAEQLQKMINDLLDLARSDAGKLRIETEPTPVRALAQQAGRQMRPSFEERGQELTVSVEKGVPDIEADPGRIGQVLSNLLTNASKYSPEGATVKLSAASDGGGLVEFAVADDGPGLDEQQLKHVFDRFWRAQSGETQAVGGTGLGLAIAKSLVELHGGTISADSRPGKGTTFRFVLPACSGGAPPSRRRGPVPSKRKVKVRSTR